MICSSQEEHFADVLLAFLCLSGVDMGAVVKLRERYDYAKAFSTGNGGKLTAFGQEANIINQWSYFVC